MANFYATTNENISYREKEHMAIVRNLAAECMVILENDGVLPLRESTGNVALFGNGGRHTIKGGTGSGDVNSREVIHIEKGLEEAGFTITTKSWLDDFEQRVIVAKESYQQRLDEYVSKEGVSRILASFRIPYVEPEGQEITDEIVKSTDTNIAIYVVSRTSGEGRDRRYEEGDFCFTSKELKDISTIAMSYSTSIVLLNVGGIVEVSKLNQISGINAIVLIGQLGNVTGHAVADALLAKTIPSGRLSDTWGVRYEDYPSCNTYGHINKNLDDEYYQEGIYVGYRYFDTFGIVPEYCFGYGKSYTSFSINTLEIKANEQQVDVLVEVTNTGKYHPGKEVVQVYYSAPKGLIEKPYQELVAFHKTKLLEPGEKQVLQISFSVNSMASYSEKEAAWILEKGDYAIRVGHDSRTTRIIAILNLTQTVKTVQLKNLFQDTQILHEISTVKAKPYTYPTEDNERQKAERILIDSKKIICENVEYQKERPEYIDQNPDRFLTMEDVVNKNASLEEFIAQLTVEEMADLCVGIARDDMEKTSIIGMASDGVPGAAGETTSHLLQNRKIKNLILADGPAGLRLYPHFRTTKEGSLLPGGEVLSDVVNPLPESPPLGAIDYYQYCTAIPIASMLAQSWDMELIQTMGNIIGKEMEEFHIHLWLAPGMNIHRNPLCGRNFEYYSEDPLLSGKCAVAEVKGVQTLDCQGATIKHFAANNQEDNRMLNNAHISERALREIYLKGFEIAVKESRPLSIMTSYNLVNGIHAANHYELLQSAARDEWGFDGLVMSDWYTSVHLYGHKPGKYPISSSPLCIKAGNDLQMPGAKENIKDIIDALNQPESAESITLADLQVCVYHILQVALKLVY